MCCGLDPYKLENFDMSADPSECPLMSFSNLFNYIKNSKSSYSNETFNANKALSAKSFLNAAWIQEIEVGALLYAQQIPLIFLYFFLYLFI